MGNMITRPIASAAERIAASTYLWGHTGSGPAADRRFAATDIVMKDASGNVNLANNVSIQFKNTSGTDLAMLNVNGSNNLLFGPSGAFVGSYIFYSGGAELARLTSAGELCLGVTAASVSTKFSVLAAANGISLRVGNGAVGAYMSNTSGTAAWQPFSFNNNGNSYNQIGSITCSSTATAYNTSSDYRLKGQIEDLEGCGAFIDAIRPRKWIFNIDGSPGAGFIAHEFAEVSPSSVHGEKDEIQIRKIVDEETGEETEVEEPKYQSMQASSPEVMANIIAELQSLRARVAELESAAS